MKRHEKNSWEATLTAIVRRIPHEFFSCQFVLFVVKRVPLSQSLARLRIRLRFHPSKQQPL